MGKIIYKLLPKLNFLAKVSNTEVIKDYMKDLPFIVQTFQKMLQHPQLDPKGYCVEVYFNEKDVQCLVKLIDE